MRQRISAGAFRLLVVLSLQAFRACLGGIVAAPCRQQDERGGAAAARRDVLAGGALPAAISLHAGLIRLGDFLAGSADVAREIFQRRTADAGFVAASHLLTVGARRLRARIA